MSELPDQQTDVYQRLLARDPTAPNELAVLFLEPLANWLAVHNPAISEDLIADAAEDALLALIKNPASYRPEKADLEAFLRMSAQGDLRNRLRSEARHRTGRRSLESVEHSGEGGNCLGRDDDPSLPLQIEEEWQSRRDAVPAAVRGGLSEGESRVLDLMLAGERRTEVFAGALGITQLPPDEQRWLVKKVKDRLQKRLERAGGDYEST
jgi:DNA-directed RNA polymerase specialized sigma24 family protein